MGQKRKRFCNKHIHPCNVWDSSWADTMLFIKLYIVNTLYVKFNMCLNQQYSIWIHQFSTKLGRRTVRVNDYTGRHTGRHKHTVTYTLIQTLWLCTGIYTGWWQGHYSLVSPMRAGVWLRQGSRVSQCGRTELRWEGPGPFITPVVCGPGAPPPSLSFSSFTLCLSLCLHQINGPVPNRGSVSISTACQACPSPRQHLIHHGFDTHTRAQMFICAFPPVLCCWAMPQARSASGYMLLNPLQLSVTSRSNVTACLSVLPLHDFPVEFWMILFGCNGWNTIG